MRSRAPLLVVLAATAVAFLPALGAGFVNFDDETNFLKNPNYRGFSASTLSWMFSDVQGHYIPLTWLTLALDYELWGMDARGYHLTNLLLHLAAAAVFYAVLVLLLRRVAGGPEPPGLRWAAAAGALAFSIHPLRVESVAWVTERRDVLSGVFVFACVWAYLRAPDAAGRARWLSLSGGLFAASLLCKTTGMTLPLVLVALDVWPLDRVRSPGWRRVLLEKLPLGALMLAAVVGTWLTQREVRALVKPADYGWAHSLIQPGYRMSFYLVKMLWPAALQPAYLWRIGQPAVQPLFLLADAAFAATSWALAASRRTRPALAAAFAAYVLLIAPVSGVFQAGPHFAADRYTYLALAPFAALAGGFVLSRWGSRAALAGAAAVLAALGGLTFRQAGFWKDSMALWNHALEVDPGNPLALNNRGSARSHLGDLKGALADFNAALASLPGHPVSLRGRGHVALKLGRPREALADFDQALRIEPHVTAIYLARGTARVQLGDLDGAMADFDRVLREDPRNSEALANRGVIFHQRRRLPEALADYDAALAADPALTETRFNRALVRIDGGDVAGARQDLDELLRRSPGDVDALLRRSRLRASGDPRGAEEDLAAALAGAPPGWPRRAEAEAELNALRSRH
jgi:protein O-mannosyl-transferase